MVISDAAPPTLSSCVDIASCFSYATVSQPNVPGRLQTMRVTELRSPAQRHASPSRGTSAGDYTALVNVCCILARQLVCTNSVLIGVGNAYSDEVLHAARLSPYATAGKLTDDTVDRLHEALQRVLLDAVARSVGQGAARLKAEKRSGLAVHARAGLPCPVCGDTVREVSFADRAFQYCPTCQTGGKPLADRRLSRLIR
jgi:ribosomal protein S13